MVMVAKFTTFLEKKNFCKISESERKKMALQG